MYSKSSSWGFALSFSLFCPFSPYSLSPLRLLSPPCALFNRWNTRCASSPFPSAHQPTLALSFRVRIKNRFPTTISVLIGAARRSEARYTGAVKLVPQKMCPKGSASRADKAAILRFSECTRLSQRAPPASVWAERAIYRGKSFQRLL